MNLLLRFDFIELFDRGFFMFFVKTFIHDFLLFVPRGTTIYHIKLAKMLNFETIDGFSFRKN